MGRARIYSAAVACSFSIIASPATLAHTHTHTNYIHVYIYQMVDLPGNGSYFVDIEDVEGRSRGNL